MMSRATVMDGPLISPSRAFGSLLAYLGRLCTIARVPRGVDSRPSPGASRLTNRQRSATMASPRSHPRHPSTARGGIMANRIDIDGVEHLDRDSRKRCAHAWCCCTAASATVTTSSTRSAPTSRSELPRHRIRPTRPRLHRRHRRAVPLRRHGHHAIAVLERVGVSSKVHLVGWSDGGIVAMLVALRRPDLVDRLVLIGVNFHVDGIHDSTSATRRPEDGRGLRDVRPMVRITSRSWWRSSWRWSPPSRP